MLKLSGTGKAHAKAEKYEMDRYKPCHYLSSLSNILLAVL